MESMFRFSFVDKFTSPTKNPEMGFPGFRVLYMSPQPTKAWTGDSKEVKEVNPMADMTSINDRSGKGQFVFSASSQTLQEGV